MSLLVVSIATIASIAAASQQHPASVAKPRSSAGFALRTEGGRSWLVRPDGRRFFSSGVCCVTPGDPWNAYDPSKPAYAAWRQYASGSEWADATLRRLSDWGFTTVGGWSDYETLERSRTMDMPITPVLHLGASCGAPWLDMWDPKLLRTIDDLARKLIAPYRNDPRLLGYYTDNEMGWWTSTLFQMALQQPSSSGQRQRLLAMLRDRYAASWPALLRDFDPEGAHSFGELAIHGKLYLRPGGQGVRVVQQFAAMAARRYYSLMRQMVRKYDKRALLLGDRYQSFYYPEVARAAYSDVDVVSTNLNAGWIDGNYPRFYLSTLHELARRPVMVGEFYMTSTENRSGNRNSSDGFPVTATQAARARGFATTLSSLASTPYVIGADWFQYSDEPKFGRGDGENYDMGLVDIDDRPYEELTAAAAGLHRDALHASGAPSRADARSGVPPAPHDAMSKSKPTLALLDWDRERGFVPSSSPLPTADLYVSWDRDAVYLALYASDILEDGAYRGKHTPEIDRAEWVIQPAAGHAIRIRLGAGRGPVSSDARVQVVDSSGKEYYVRTIAAARLPAALFDKTALLPGDTIRLSCRFVGHARCSRVEWGGEYRLAR